MTDLKIGVVGCGVFGNYHISKYIELSKLINGIKLTHVCDNAYTASKSLQDMTGITFVTDIKDMFDKVDMVSICTPALTHYEYSRAFLEAGIHVLVEKPIATTVKQADELIALAQKNNLILTVGHQERYVFDNLGILAIPEVPKSISAWRENIYDKRGTDVSVVVDLMIHDIDLVHMLVPYTINKISSTGTKSKSNNIDKCSVLIDFNNKIMVSLSANRNAKEKSRGMILSYESGNIKINFITRKIVNTTKYKLNEFCYSDPLSESVANFVMSVKGLMKSLVTAEEARRALSIAIRIEKRLKVDKLKKEKT